MSVPLWVLLAFALWTLATLTATVGIYRWRRILAGRAGIGEFRYDKFEGYQDWYRRGTRAHANCVENLPVYGAIALIIAVTGVDTRALDILAVTVIVARVCQTVVHVAFFETNRTVSVRFTFFSIQLAAMLAMGAILIAKLHIA